MPLPSLQAVSQPPRPGLPPCRDGAGADGMATPQYTAYGGTKAGIAHAYKSLQHETRGSAVAVHMLSPGMVLTPLLLDGATDENKAVFNILCEHPETCAAYLVPRARTVVARGSRGAYLRFLTLPRALARFLSAPFRANKFFDAEGGFLGGWWVPGGCRPACPLQQRAAASKCPQPRLAA